MRYDECLRSIYVHLDSWIIALVGLTIAFFLWRFGKTGLAIACVGLSLLAAVSWAYLYYELNCVELYGL